MGAATSISAPPDGDNGSVLEPNKKAGCSVPMDQASQSTGRSSGSPLALAPPSAIGGVEPSLRRRRRAQWTPEGGVADAELTKDAALACASPTRHTASSLVPPLRLPPSPDALGWDISWRTHALGSPETLTPGCHANSGRAGSSSSPLTPLTPGLTPPAPFTELPRECGESELALYDELDQPDTPTSTAARAAAVAATTIDADSSSAPMSSLLGAVGTEGDGGGGAIAATAMMGAFFGWGTLEESEPPVSSGPVAAPARGRADTDTSVSSLAQKHVLKRQRNYNLDLDSLDGMSDAGGSAGAVRKLAVPPAALGLRLEADAETPPARQNAFWVPPHLHLQQAAADASPAVAALLSARLGRGSSAAAHLLAMGGTHSAGGDLAPVDAAGGGGFGGGGGGRLSASRELPPVRPPRRSFPSRGGSSNGGGGGAATRARGAAAACGDGDDDDDAPLPTASGNKWAPLAPVRRGRFAGFGAAAYSGAGGALAAVMDLAGWGRRGVGVLQAQEEGEEKDEEDAGASPGATSAAAAIATAREEYTAAAADVGDSDGEGAGLTASAGAEQQQQQQQQQQQNAMDEIENADVAAIVAAAAAGGAVAAPISSPASPLVPRSPVLAALAGGGPLSPQTPSPLRYNYGQAAAEEYYDRDSPTGMLDPAWTTGGRIVWQPDSGTDAAADGEILPRRSRWSSSPSSSLSSRSSSLAAPRRRWRSPSSPERQPTPTEAASEAPQVAFGDASAAADDLVDAGDAAAAAAARSDAAPDGNVAAASVESRPRRRTGMPVGGTRLTVNVTTGPSARPSLCSSASGGAELGRLSLASPPSLGSSPSGAAAAAAGKERRRSSLSIKDKLTSFKPPIVDVRTTPSLGGATAAASRQPQAYTAGSPASAARISRLRRTSAAAAAPAAPDAGSGSASSSPLSWQHGANPSWASAAAAAAGRAGRSPGRAEVGTGLGSGRRRSPPRRRASPPRRGTSPNRKHSGSPVSKQRQQREEASAMALLTTAPPRAGRGQQNNSARQDDSGAVAIGAAAAAAAAGAEGAPWGVTASPRGTLVATAFRPRNMRSTGSNVSSLDDEEWVPVSDDDMSLELSPRRQRPSLSVHLNAKTEDSYEFTRSGGINLTGFGVEIRETGLGRRSWGPGCPAAGGGAAGGLGTRRGGGEGHAVPMRERLAVLCKLGQGATGVVFKAFDLSELRVVALKVVPVFDRTKRRQMLHELRALHYTLSQPPRPPPRGAPPWPAPGLLPRDCLVAFFDAFSNREEGSVSLMVEYMDGGSLQDISLSGGLACENTLANVAFQCLTGLQFLHRCKQIHRDIKPANMLINQNGEVKISDFGIVRTLEEPTPRTGRGSPAVSPALSTSNAGGAAQATVPGTGCAPETVQGAGNAPGTVLGTGNALGSVSAPGTVPETGSAPGTARERGLKGANTFVGTITYMSPERINGQLYGFPSDVWSLGLALMATAEGRHPIDTKGGYWSVLHCIRDDPPPTLPEGKWSPTFRDFVASCLRKDPAQRATTAQLLSHPFVKPVADRVAAGGSLREAPPVELLANNLAELEAVLLAVEEHVRRISAEGPEAFASILTVGGGGSNGSSGSGGNTAAAAKGPWPASGRSRGVSVDGAHHLTSGNHGKSPNNTGPPAPLPLLIPSPHQQQLLQHPHSARHTLAPAPDHAPLPLHRRSASHDSPQGEGPGQAGSAGRAAAVLLRLFRGPGSQRRLARLAEQLCVPLEAVEFRCQELIGRALAVPLPPPQPQHDMDVTGNGGGGSDGDKNGVAAASLEGGPQGLVNNSE